MPSFKLNRRAVLRGGGVALALPALDAMLSDRGLFYRVAHAQNVPPPKRLFLYFFPNGIHRSAWHPTTEGTGYALTPLLQPLAPVKNDVLVVSNLDRLGGKENASGIPEGEPGIAGPHGCATATTFTAGYPTSSGVNGPSFDQLIAAHASNTARFRTFAVAPSSASQGLHYNAVSWTAANSAVPVERDARALFDRIFGGMTTDGSTPAPAGPDYDQSILDRVKGDVTRLKARLGAADRARLEEHLTALRELERTLAPPPATSTSCVKPGTPAGGNPDVETKQLFDVLAMAMKCDLVRVCSYMAERGGSVVNYSSWLSGVGPSVEWHNSGHFGPTEDYRQYVLYAVRNFVYLVEKLRGLSEGGGTVLDNSLVLCTNEISEAASHRWENLPMLLAGKLGGAIRPGRAMKYATGTPVANLYLTLLHLFGRTDVNAFGNVGTQLLGGLA